MSLVNIVKKIIFSSSSSFPRLVDRFFSASRNRRSLTLAKKSGVYDAARALVVRRPIIENGGASGFWSNGCFEIKMVSRGRLLDPNWHFELCITQEKRSRAGSTLEDRPVLHVLARHGRMVTCQIQPGPWMEEIKRLAANCTPR